MKRTTAHAIALAMLDGAWEARAACDRVAALLEVDARSILPLVERVMEGVSERPRDAGELADDVRYESFYAWDDPGEALSDEGLADAELDAEPASVVIADAELAALFEGRPVITRWPLVAEEVGAAPSFAPDVPRPASIAELGELLGVEVRELLYFADERHVRERASASPYRYRWVAKANGGSRLIEAPSERLRIVQRRVLERMLSHVPAHDAAHGFVRHRSPWTFARVHAQSDFVLRLDLEDFFASIGRERVRRTWMTLGQAPSEARALARITNCKTPSAVLRVRPEQPDPDRAWRSARRFRSPHLPQGAPTSPALANLAAYRLDTRLAGLARKLGARYARYADDLALSGGELARSWRRVVPRVAAIAVEEGLVLRFDKTKPLPASARQQLCGLVLNESPGVARDAYDRLRARLRTLAASGFAGEASAREALARELRGHVAHASGGRSGRAKKLERLLAEALERVSDTT